MSVISVTDRRMVMSGDIGYDLAEEVVSKCSLFMSELPEEGGEIDLTEAEAVVSSVISAIYASAYQHQPRNLKLLVNQRLAYLFSPGESVGLFKLEVR